MLAVAPIILLFMAYASVAQPAVFACPSGESVIYQDRPCPISKKKETEVTSRNQFPLAIHPSWFDLPEQVEERAFCDRSGCECGRLEQRHEVSLIQSVADALYLDGSWHRYESSYQKWLASPASSWESRQQREQMLDASCHIMMSQLLLRKYADDIIEILKKRVRAAEERGFDIALPCEQGDAKACDYFASVEMYSRILRDAAALRRSRDGANASSADLTSRE